jgi:hypothetical protein
VRRRPELGQAIPVEQPTPEELGEGR